MSVRTLVFAVIVLMVINIAALATIVYQRVSFHHWAGGRPEMVEPDFRMLHMLKLSKEQREMLSSSRHQADSLVAPLYAEMHEKRQTLFAELNKDKPDTTITNGLLLDISKLQTDIGKTFVSSFLKDSGSLQPEQREILLRLIETRTMGNEPGRRFPGRGFGRGL